MRITCYDGMGYIFLKPSKEGKYESSKNEISNYVNLDQIKIPFVTNEKVLTLY
jgi:hypothetical protein